MTDSDKPMMKFLIITFFLGCLTWGSIVGWVIYKIWTLIKWLWSL